AADSGHSEWSPTSGKVKADDLAALKAMVADRTLPLPDRVSRAAAWIETGHYPGLLIHRSAVEAERRATLELINKVTIRGVRGAAIACIETTSRYGLSAAYAAADLVVAVNPAHQWPDGRTTRKVTIAQTSDGPELVDLAAVYAELGDGWGGQARVGGSPQGEHCDTPVDDVLAAIGRHLR
ncbi:MAG: hypothetical protein ACRCZP_06955, partial [Phycicoccus sp.]